MTGITITKPELIGTIEERVKAGEEGPRCEDTMLLSITDQEGELYLIAPVSDVSVKNKVYNPGESPLEVDVELDPSIPAEKASEIKTKILRTLGDSHHVVQLTIRTTIPRKLVPPVFFCASLTDDPGPRYAHQWVSLGYSRLLWNLRSATVLKQTDDEIVLLGLKKGWLFQRHVPER